jgi:hypothetical protein
MKFAKSTLVIALLCSSLCHAEVIRNQHGDYAFAFPQGWALDRSEKYFKVVGPNKVELSELPLPPPPAKQTLEAEVHLFEQSLALVWDTHSTGQAFDLSGRKWEGRILVLDLLIKPIGVPCKIVAFVAKSGKQFRHFYFLMPTQEWQNNSQQYLAILKSLKFPDSGQGSE